MCIRSASSLGDDWMFRIGRPGGTRVNAEGGRDFGAEWTPDGLELIYSGERPFFDLYRRAADASRPAEPLLTGDSPDGRRFAFVLSVPGGPGLWTVALGGEPEAARCRANGFNPAQPTISPDGRWMACDSDESGRIEVYAQWFREPNLKRWKVSPAEGSQPLWTRGGWELVRQRPSTPSRTFRVAAPDRPRSWLQPWIPRAREATLTFPRPAPASEVVS